MGNVGRVNTRDAHYSNRAVQSRHCRKYEQDMHFQKYHKYLLCSTQFYTRLSHLTAFPQKKKGEKGALSQLDWCSWMALEAFPTATLYGFGRVRWACGAWNDFSLNENKPISLAQILVLIVAKRLNCELPSFQSD